MLFQRSLKIFSFLKLIFFFSPWEISTTLSSRCSSITLYHQIYCWILLLYFLLTLKSLYFSALIFIYIFKLFEILTMFIRFSLQFIEPLFDYYWTLFRWIVYLHFVFSVSEVVCYLFGTYFSVSSFFCILYVYFSVLSQSGEVVITWGLAAHSDHQSCVP